MEQRRNNAGVGDASIVGSTAASSGTQPRPHEDTLEPQPSDWRPSDQTVHALQFLYDKVVREKDDRYVLLVKGLCNIITPEMGV